ncbi:hypothetical protein EYC84_008253 [Monilinia fructicola]|uniref:Cytochrome c oxidase assembly protein n=1 Tax=Monilinia fructicola TaxID=38448 RepID=A0A5M9JEK0_MONFR|nr:hypothetical protein EYC84_008253 [Monilinia fructicola]
MPSSCQDIRAALAQCLQESDCVMVYRNKPSDCLRAPLLETMPTKCQQLKKGYGECKRGLVDMRKRFRGNQPISLSKELEGGGERNTGGHMLYAGKPAFDSGVKETKRSRNRSCALEGGYPVSYLCPLELGLFTALKGVQSIYIQGIMQPRLIITTKIDSY